MNTSDWTDLISGFWWVHFRHLFLLCLCIRIIGLYMYSNPYLVWTSLLMWLLSVSFTTLKNALMWSEQRLLKIYRITFPLLLLALGYINISIVSSILNICYNNFLFFLDQIHYVRYRQINFYKVKKNNGYICWNEMVYINTIRQIVFSFIHDV